MNEADTRRTYIVPKLKSAGWEAEYITEQRRIVTYLHGLRAKVNALRELHSASREKLSAGGWLIGRKQ